MTHPAKPILEPNPTQPIQISRPFWHQLRWSLTLAFMLLAVLPVLIVVVIVLPRLQAQAREQMTNQLEAVAELKQAQIEQWVTDGGEVLDVFLAEATTKRTLIAFVAATLPNTLSITEDSLVGARQNDLNRLLNDIVQAQSSFTELFLYNAEGRVVAASDPGQIGKILVRRSYFAGSLTQNVIQPPYYEVGVTGITMLMTRPLVDPNGQTVGVLAGRLDMHTLGQIMTNRTGLGQTGETYLVSRESNYLVTPSRFEAEGYSLTRAYFSQGIERVLQGESGAGIYGDYRHPPVTVIGVYRWLPDLQVGLLAEVNDAEALTAFNLTRNFSLGLALVAALVSALVGFYSDTRIAQPVAELTQTAANIAAGDLNQRANVPKLYEIAVLATTFNNMTARLRELVASLELRITELRQAKMALQESEGRYSSLIDDILDNSTVGIFILDTDFRVVWINRAMAEYFGLQRVEVIGQDKRQLIQSRIKDKFESPEAFATKVLATYDDNSYTENFECHIFPGDNDRERWLEHRSQPIQSGLYTGGRIEHYYDISQRRRAELALRESEERFRSVFEQAAVGICYSALDGAFVRVNRRFCDIAGYSAGELLQITFREITHPDDLELDLVNVHRLLAGELETYSMPKRYIRQDGSIVWVNLTVSLMRDTAGVPKYFIGVIEDITGRKQAEEQIKASLEEKEVLLKEIHHRVKNNLQIVSSLLDLQADNIKEESVRELFKESQQRIKSMALIHERLYQNQDLARIDFAEYVESLTGHLLRSYGARASNVSFHLNITPVALTIEVAIPCGLIINELISNAFKHAFPNGQSGDIWLELQFNEAQQLILWVKDNGVGVAPEIDFRRTQSLGLTLVMTLVKQLKGAIELNDQEGTAFKITFTDTMAKID